MSLEELAKDYRAAAAPIRLRLRQLRQAPDMGKQCVGLAQPQRPLLYRKQLSAILPQPVIQIGNGGGIIAGINANHTHISFPLSAQ